jgi:formylglycine-generating enzyme required for sulfatase activity
LRRGDSKPAVYGWDNEFGAHSAKVDQHKVSDRLVTNADFLQFVLDRGYEKKELWSAEGWNWASG